MDKNRSFSYSKESKQAELLNARSDSEVQEKPDSGWIIPIETISGYRKVDGILPANLICVISGGTTRERDFLNELVKKNTFSNIRVIFLSTSSRKGGLTPKMMNDRYTQIQSNHKISYHGTDIVIDEDDAFYMFTDVDHYENELVEIVSSCKEKDKPIWIISNPSLEIWIYYCYRNKPYEELSSVFEVKPSERSSHLKTINGTFNSGGGLDPRKAFEHLHDGITNSKVFYKVDENNIPELLTTNMFVFAEDILGQLGQEYLKWIEVKQEWRNRMKK